MAYDADKEIDQLTALTDIDNADYLVVGDTSDANETAKAITWANVKSLITTHVEALSSYFNKSSETLDNITAGTTNKHFTATDESKLDGIEAGATADQTGAEIKAAYEAEADTNAFTDAEKTKLAGIEALADVTDATNVAAAGAVMASTVNAKGDLYVATADNTVTRLGVGTNAQVLTADSTQATGVKWAANPAGFSDPMTTRGDIIVRDATNTTARLAVGGVGEVLTSDGTDVSWGTVGNGDVTKVGTPADNQVGVWTGDGTIEGDADLTFDGGLGVTVADAENKNALTINQNDVTTGSDPHGIVVNMANEGAALKVVSASGTSQGPFIELYHQSPTPAVGDSAVIDIYSRNNVNTDKQIATIFTDMEDVTNGSEDASFQVSLIQAGSLATSFKVNDNINGVHVGASTGTGVVSSNGNTDLTLQTGNATTGYINITDGANGDITLMPNGTGSVGVNTASPTAKLEVTVDDTDNQVGLTITQNDSTNAPYAISVTNVATGGDVYLQNTNETDTGVILQMHQNSASPTAGDTVGMINFNGEDSASNQTTYGRIGAVINDTTNGSENGYLFFATPINSGIATTRLLVGNDINGIHVGASSAAGIVSSNGSQDLTLQTGNATTGNITITDGANGNITLSPNGTGQIVAGNDVALGENSLQLDPSLSGDETWSGITVTATAGATLAVGDVCYLASSGKWLLNDGILDGTDTGFSKQLGICLSASTDTNPTEILLYGRVRSAAFPAFTVGSPVYLDDTAGDLTVTQPSTTNFAIRIVGYALTAEDLMFAPSPDYIVHV